MVVEMDQSVGDVADPSLAFGRERGREGAVG